MSTLTKTGKRISVLLDEPDKSLLTKLVHAELQRRNEPVSVSDVIREALKALALNHGITA